MVIKNDSPEIASHKNIFRHEYSNFYEGQCTLSNFIHLISQKWTIPLILEFYRSEQLEPGKKLRFNELNKIFHNTRPRVLSKRLKELEQADIILREKFNEMPIRVEYSLTEKGLELGNKFVELDFWEKNWNLPNRI